MISCILRRNTAGDYVPLSEQDVVLWSRPLLDEAERLGVPFLGEVPLHMTIREKSDAGLPVVATEPDGPHAKIYRDIAARVRDQLKGGGAGRTGPKIVIER